MNEVSYLNIEYILLKVYQLFAGVDAGEIPSQTLIVIERVAWAGMFMSFIFLVMIVFFRIKLGHVEHAGWHRRLEEEVKLSQKQNERTAVNPRWQQVLTLMESPAPGGESDWRRAILEADNILAELLTSRGFQGEGVGEQLRSANPLQFTTLDLAWQAHKVRNTIAHVGEGYPLSEREARGTIDLYRRVFEEFNYI